MRKITNFNEYRELVISGELDFEKLFKGTDANKGFEITRKIVNKYVEIIYSDKVLYLHKNELDLITAMFALIGGFGRMEPQYRDMELEANLYALIETAKQSR